MTDQTKQQELAKAGRELDQSLRRYWAFVEKTVRKYVDDSKGGTVNYVAAIISREHERLQLVIENPFSYKSISDKRLDGSQWEALIERKALYDDLSGFFDAKSHHQLELQKAMAGADGLTKSERERLQRDVPKLSTLIDQFGAVLVEIDRQSEKTDSFDKKDPHYPSASDKDRPDPNSSSSQTGGTKMSDSKCSDNPCTADGLRDVVDAISRLQSDTSGGGVGSASNAYNLFGSELDQKIQTTLGMPNLGSDGALAMDRDDLLDKLFDGLDRSVIVKQTDSGSQFQFNPLKARGSALGSEMNALGAQAVTADHIRALKEPILSNLYRLVPENVYSEQLEADDLRRAIEDGIDKLAIEASAELGAFDIWATSLFEQIYRDLLSLAALYGIKTKGELLCFVDLSQKSGDTVESIFSAIPMDRAHARVFKDPDIGILTAEANDKAILAIIFNLTTMCKLLVDDSSLGPLLGRIRAFNDAISASVIVARNALATAGISIEDQTVSFSNDGTSQESNISLRRLLGWIESESIMSRPVLLKADLNARDLDRLRAARSTQSKALSQILTGDFATVNTNRYAVGRRHLNELDEHLTSITGLMESLIKQSSAFDTKR
jgi:hypothetical protein